MQVRFRQRQISLYLVPKILKACKIVLFGDLNFNKKSTDCNKTELNFSVASGLILSYFPPSFTILFSNNTY